MTHLIPVGEGMGIQIPPHLIKAAHLDDASDLFFEVTKRGLLISPPPRELSLFLESCNPPSHTPEDIDALIGQAVLDNDRD
jgi:antitoxin component of MazEF toxin-antitoxin module